MEVDDLRSKPIEGNDQMSAMSVGVVQVPVRAVALGALLSVRKTVRSSGGRTRRKAFTSGVREGPHQGGRWAVTPDLRPAKEVASREFPPGHPGREALLCAPDEVSADEFDLLVPMWIRLLRLSTRL